MSKNLSDIFPPTEIGGGGGGIEEAPKTGKIYGRQDEAWQEFEIADIEPGNKDGETLAWSTADAEYLPNDTLIVKGGNVGIGTDNPGSSLSIQTGDNSRVETTDGTASLYSGVWAGRSTIHSVNSELDINALGSHPVVFKTNSTERMRIESSGDVEVAGQLNASFLLAKKSSTSTNLITNQGGSLHLHNPSATDGNFSNIGGYNSNDLVTSQIDFINTNQAARTGEIAFFTHNGSGMPERLRIDVAGRVGIGGQPSRSTKEIEDEAVATLATWDSKDKKPTKAELIKSLTERNIGGGDAKLQVAGDGYFSGDVYANGSPLTRTRDLIETLSTLREATQDETTLEGLRDSIGNAIGGLIEKFEAMADAVDPSKEHKNDS